MQDLQLYLMRLIRRARGREIGGDSRWWVRQHSDFKQTSSLNPMSFEVNLRCLHPQPRDRRNIKNQLRAIIRGLNQFCLWYIHTRGDIEHQSRDAAGSGQGEGAKIADFHLNLRGFACSPRQREKAQDLRPAFRLLEVGVIQGLGLSNHRTKV